MDDGFDNLRGLLKDQNYPSVYLFKFIVKKDFAEMTTLKNCFSETAEFSIHQSSKGNWVSLNVREMMLNTDEIILRYQRVNKIKNVMAL